ncbi:MAG: SUMF1/EgtB/PvdO family nonheme iron enzyme, partial [Clostridia bacterium]|nr:SUMF1/EgtB/PvdO family nonheme iron enzyme [Clostridia bacterium]
NVASGGTGVLQKTGYDETHPCNIYDMGGNVHEWTTEFYSDGESEYYVARGGTYDYGADSSPAAIRNGGSKNTTRNSDIGFRVALYL